ncbi:Linocin_M18 bacteriocin protein [mine drainage metagenome]|uniref:Linocin_M18 bacteriocin protein n=2 Tax=mine drainage metagenome TaxID=410659 RepID=T0ZN19_9ZZZZ
MFSKDPSELIRKETMDNEEIGRAIQLSLVAELDAINFYMQQSKIMPEGSFKAVHEDIAKEEVAHFGEFMRLLFEYAPEDFAKIKQGWKEASGMLSSSDTIDFMDTATGQDGKMKQADADFGKLVS